MAKDQDLPLNPLRISGACGRLMCCLKYEHPLYQDFMAEAPAVGSCVSTPDGEATVVGHSVPADTVVVRMASDGRRSSCAMASVCSSRKAHDEFYGDGTLGSAQCRSRRLGRAEAGLGSDQPSATPARRARNTQPRSSTNRSTVAARFAATSTLSSSARCGLGCTACRTASAPLVNASPRPNTTSPCNWWRAALRRPAMPKVNRRLAAVLATAVTSSANRFAGWAPSEPRASTNSSR